MPHSKNSPDKNFDSMTKDESQVAEHVSAEDKSSFYSFIKTVASFSGDLSQLTCPGFLLCGSSILEYCSHYGDHPALFNDIALATDSLERTVAVTRWFISTLYGSFRSRCKDNFEKKPYNPILGEKFLCQLKDANENTLNLRCEQVSHHPPVSALYLESPSSGVYLNGHCGQKSKFKGSSIKVEQVGHVTVSVLGSDETFIITLPAMYIRSLITGRPFLDLYGESYVYSSAGYVSTIVYQQKPWFGGDYFGIEGHIKDPSGNTLKSISGKWTEEFTFTDTKTNQKLSFNSETASAAAVIVAPLSEQSGVESQKLWAEVSQAIKDQDYSLASKKKTTIEEEQRALRREREENNESWAPELFVSTEDDPVIQKVKAALKQPIVDVDNSSWIFKTPLNSQ